MIHPTAIIEKGARISEGVEVGPFCIIGPDVEIGTGTVLDSHIVIKGHTKIGNDNKIFPYASIGHAPQDLKYKGEPTRVEIGDRNLVRECVTVNLGTATGRGLTSIGSDNILMAYSHVAHDCEVHDHVVIANSVALAGHVVLEDYVVLGGFTGVTQFNRVGKHAYIGAYSLIRADFPPFLTGKGLDDFKVQSVNSIGLERRGVPEENIRKLKNAYKLLYVKKGITFQDAVNTLSGKEYGCPEVTYLLEFIASSNNGIVR
ncbi:MAG: acyl-ACP--UDP-N-acetylglucosamine O-acyltransferase [Oligoflexia bacterium]|nr:acyl-ACP--UDP-N-acetylglucosamine O-acyltransferase [Oligoflexia bacterium]